MLKPGRAIFLWLLTVSTLITGCGGLLGGTSESKAVQQVIDRALENQVFVDGGAFILGDIGRASGTPYVTLTDFSRPAVEVSIDSYSISRYETTWGEMKAYYEALDRAQLYTDNVTLKEYTKATDNPLSPNYYRKPARAPNYGEAEGYCAC